MSSPLEQLVHLLSRLPGIGEKTASRLAFFILKQSKSYAQDLSSVLNDLHQKIQLCPACQNLTQQIPCSICVDTKRESRTLLVVEMPQDLLAIERSQFYRGKYHILHGAISPLEGISPDQLKISELLLRLEAEAIEEVILGTNANVEGDATALYLNKLLRPLGVKTTRLASGMPVGGGIEYLDPLTFRQALEGRRALPA